MNNKLFIARTKAALKSRAEINSLDLNNYVIFKITDKARQSASLKSLATGIDNPEYKYLMVLKDFVVITTDGGLQVDTSSLPENDYAQDLNTPEEEAPGDKYVVDGVCKSLLEKLPNIEGLTDEEREVATKALKSWGEHGGEEVSSEEEFVDELDENGEAKSQNTDDEPRPSTKEDNTDTQDDEAPVEKKFEAAGVAKSESASDEDEDEDSEEETDENGEAVTKSARERLSRLSEANQREQVMAKLKSFGSLMEDKPVFQTKGNAQKFAQTYNNKVKDTSRAEVRSADRHTRRRYGTKARFIVDIND